VVILPWALPGAITAVIWMWIFHPSWGLLNLGLYELGLIGEYIPWLRDRMLVRLSVVVAHVWSHFPFAAVLFMAALSAIDPELYEQARIDGAGPWQRFRYVTFPQIKAFVVILLIYESLMALTSYDIVYAMTGGGPGTTTTLLAFQIWRDAPSELIVQRARDGQPIPWDTLLPHHFRALLQAQLALPPEVSRLAPLDALVTGPPILPSWELR
jgi:multiple sugar transport system permease protein